MNKNYEIQYSLPNSGEQNNYMINFARQYGAMAAKLARILYSREGSMRSIELEGIHHIAIICSDYEMSKDFYVNVLGMRIIKETYREDRDSYKLDLALGEDYLIELFSFPNPPRRLSYPEAAGLRHLAFKVNDITKAVEELQKKGIAAEPARIDYITGKQFTFFSDPDGLPIELYEE